MGVPIEHSTTCDSRIHMNCVKAVSVSIGHGIFHKCINIAILIRLNNEHCSVLII